MEIKQKTVVLKITYNELSLLKEGMDQLVEIHGVHNCSDVVLMHEKLNAAYQELVNVG